MPYHIRVRACALVIENEAVLLVEFEDESGVHYNLPAGGVEPGESVVEAVRREAREEASVDVEVGPLAFVYEYFPDRDSAYTSEIHQIGLIFECRLQKGSRPAMPAAPDANQTGVRWVPLSELDRIVLYPNIKRHIKEYAARRGGVVPWIEDHTLELQ
jgi:8-oxo-dGTP diphosphatase